VRDWLTGQAMRQSMSGTGNCYDNAPMESFWHSLKVEETHGQDFATRAEATHCVFAYIEGWYNTTRMHSSLGYQSPGQFERECRAKLIEAANDDPATIPSNASHSARLNKRAA
jgi:transposase InsO family protein